jgi:hypothetical protein
MSIGLKRLLDVGAEDWPYRHGKRQGLARTLIHSLPQALKSLKKWQSQATKNALLVVGVLD